jgi:hypothetical protein
MKRICLLPLFLVLILVLTGCRPLNPAQDQQTNIRIVNAISDAPSVSIYYDRKPLFDEMGYLESTGYFKINTGTHKIEASMRGTFTPILSTSSGFPDNQDSTLVIYGSAAAPRTTRITDYNDRPKNDTARVRTLNVASLANSVSVYVFDPSEPFVDAPLAKGVGFGAASDYVTSNSGSFTVRVVTSDSGEIIAEKPLQELASESIYTIVVADNYGPASPVKMIVLEDR